jgi:hypothetical protein
MVSPKVHRELSHGLDFHVVLWIVSACLGAWIASQKGRSGVEGLILGFLFGPMGVIVEAVLPTKSS